MLCRPEGKVLADNFAAQWLNLESWRSTSPIPSSFRPTPIRCGDAMMTETKTFFSTSSSPRTPSIPRFY